MEEAETDKMLDGIDGRSPEPADISKNMDSALRGRKMATRSVTSKQRRRSIASDGENVPLTSRNTKKSAVLAIAANDHDTCKNPTDVEDRVTSGAEFAAEIGELKSTGKQLKKQINRVNENGKKRKSAVKRQSKPRSKFPCQVCGKPYTKFYMEAHMQLHSGEKPFCCQEPACKRQFATEYYLRMHVQRCHARSQCHPCGVCQRQLASKRGLLEHMRTHSEERPFVCQACGKGFRQPALLFNHIKTHDDRLPFQCEQCGVRYKYKRSMERHKEKVHEGVRHSFPCGLCERAFSTKSKLKEHQYLHEGNSPHVCQVCGKRLLARKTLQNHMLIHQGEKPYRCEVCGKRFRFGIVLKRHLSVHTGVKPFRCDTCGRQFIHRVYMDRHKCGTKLEAIAAGDCATESVTDAVDVECESVEIALAPGEQLYTFIAQCDNLV